MGVLSKGISLSYGEKKLTNLMELAELGGSTEAVDITTLESAAFRYMDGLKNYGDNLEFKFLYEKEQFTELNGLTGSQQWKVEIPEGENSESATCSFSGTCSVKLESAAVNTALTYILAIKPNSEMVWA